MITSQNPLLLTLSWIDSSTRQSILNSRARLCDTIEDANKTIQSCYSGCPVVPSAGHPLTACVAVIWYRYHQTDTSGTRPPLRAVPTNRYDGTIGAIFSHRKKATMMLLFPNEIFYLLKPADNQRIEQTFRKLVVLNVVGSNPTSHPKRESSAVAEDFLFCTLPP